MREGHVIGRTRFVDGAGDGQVLGEVIAASEHLPVKESTRHASVAIDERMKVREPEVQNDCADEGMKKGLRVLLIREAEQGFQAFWQLIGGRGFEPDGTLEVFDPDVFLRRTQSTSAI